MACIEKEKKEKEIGWSFKNFKLQAFIYVKGPVANSEYNLIFATWDFKALRSQVRWTGFTALEIAVSCLAFGARLLWQRGSEILKETGL